MKIKSEYLLLGLSTLLLTSALYFKFEKIVLTQKTNSLISKGSKSPLVSPAFFIWLKQKNSIVAELSSREPELFKSVIPYLKFTQKWRVEDALTAQQVQEILSYYDTELSQALVKSQYHEDPHDTLWLSLMRTEEQLRAKLSLSSR